MEIGTSAIHFGVRGAIGLAWRLRSMLLEPLVEKRTGLVSDTGHIVCKFVCL